MACELQPHNLREVADAAVAMINRPSITVEALMDIIQGPDFPGGGQIISPRQAIIDAYASGRGSLRARCRWKIEHLARGQWQAIVIYDSGSPAGDVAALERRHLDAGLSGLGYHFVMQLLLSNRLGR
jgi:hypothetical protein